MVFSLLPLSLIVLGLLLLSPLTLPPVLRRLAFPATALLCGLGLVFACAALLDGGIAPPLHVALGTNAGATLALDGLSGFFLLPVFLSGGAAALAAPALMHSRGKAVVLLPLFLAGMALTVLAGDLFSLLFGFELMSVSSWALLLSENQPAARTAAPLYLGMALFSAACLLPAFGLMLPPDGGWSFAELRAMPPTGWRAIAVMALVVLGAGSKAGLAPLHLWLPVAHPAAPTPVSAIMSAGMTKVALYVIVRILFDLCGPAVPGWWGVPLLAAGGLSALLGALRAVMETDMKAILAASTVENIGLIAMGLGTALAARGADLPPLASLAMGAALLHVLNHAVFKTALFLTAGGVHHAAGTRRLDRLGGLIRQMPRLTVPAMIALMAVAALPPSSGFASEWLLLQSLLAAPHVAGLATQLGFTLLVGITGLATALAGTAALRLFGVAFLGRPRTPRAAAATEAPALLLRVLNSLAVLSVALGLFPTIGLSLAAPALRQMTGLGLDRRASLLQIAPQAGQTGYAPLIVLMLLALVVVVTLAWVRQRGVAGARVGPAWDCGFTAPPAWLPFGDPTTQYGPLSFAQPIARTLGTLMFWRENVVAAEPGDARPARYTHRLHDPAMALLARPVSRIRFLLSRQANRFYALTIRQSLSVMFATLIALLALIAWMEVR